MEAAARQQSNSTASMMVFPATVATEGEVTEGTEAHRRLHVATERGQRNSASLLACELHARAPRAERRAPERAIARQRKTKRWRRPPAARRPHTSPLLVAPRILHLASCIFHIHGTGRRAFASGRRRDRAATMSNKQHWKLHSRRRRLILDEHPQIRGLFGVDGSTQLYAYVCIALQLWLVRLSCHSFSRALLLGMTIGPYVDSALLCFLHEATHMLVFRRAMLNRLIAIVANLPLLIPISEVHRQHHARHHGALGELCEDVDVPSEWEVSLVGNHRAAKAVWLMLNMIVLPARSVCRLPINMDAYLILNWLSCLLMTISIVCYSRTSFLFLALSVLNSQGLHPANARQVQRHVYDGSERMRTCEQMPSTYSYYGWLNCVMLNVGYHVEHHDFPRIPWSRLPELRRMAGEKWYPTENAYRSRGMSNMINFVMNPNISLADFAH